MSKKNAVLLDEDQNQIFPIPSDAIPVTEADFYELISNGKLFPNAVYCITDYASRLTHPYRLYVCAKTSTSVYPRASAELIPGDNYFANSKLDRWIIEVAYGNINTNTDTDPNGSSRLVVTRLVDEFNNDINFDFHQAYWEYGASGYERYKYTFTIYVDAQNLFIDHSLNGQYFHDNYIRVDQPLYLVVEVLDLQYLQTVNWEFHNNEIIGLIEPWKAMASGYRDLDHLAYMSIRNCVIKNSSLGICIAEDSTIVNTKITSAYSSFIVESQVFDCVFYSIDMHGSYVSQFNLGRTHLFIKNSRVQVKDVQFISSVTLMTVRIRNSSIVFPNRLYLDNTPGDPTLNLDNIQVLVSNNVSDDIYLPSFTRTSSSIYCETYSLPGFFTIYCSDNQYNTYSPMTYDIDTSKFISMVYQTTVGIGLYEIRLRG